MRRTTLALATLVVATPALAAPALAAAESRPNALAPAPTAEPGWLDAAIARGASLMPDEIAWPDAIAWPDDLSWWTDAAIATAGIGTTVGTAAYACGTIASPGGPIVAGLATGACAGLGSLGGTELVRSGYAFLGVTPDEDALTTGRFVGTLAGTALALGVGDLAEGARWALVARRATDRALARVWTRPAPPAATVAAP